LRDARPLPGRKRLVQFRKRDWSKDRMGPAPAAAVGGLNRAEHPTARFTCGERITNECRKGGAQIARRPSSSKREACVDLNLDHDGKVPSLAKTGKPPRLETDDGCSCWCCGGCALGQSQRRGLKSRELRVGKLPRAPWDLSADGRLGWCPRRETGAEEQTKKSARKDCNIRQRP